MPFLAQQNLTELEDLIGYHFRNIELLRQALTHKSVSANPANPQTHNEVLEYLGDAVLELAITDYLFRLWGNTKTEGVLTRRRARLINSQVLAHIGRRIHLEQWIFTRVEQTAANRFMTQLLADSLEALIGAVYLDSDFEMARRCILGLFEPELQRMIHGQPLWVDYRSILQEYIQGETHSLPKFREEGSSGPEHEKTFTMSVYLGETELGRGVGYTKKEAAQDASAKALIHLSNPDFRHRLGLSNDPPKIPGVGVEDTSLPNVEEDECPNPG